MKKPTINEVRNHLTLTDFLGTMVDEIDDINSIIADLRKGWEKEKAKVEAKEQKRLEAKTEAQAKAEALAAAKKLVAEAEAKAKAEAEAAEREKQRIAEAAKRLAEAKNLIKESQK